jgi:integrase
MRGCEVLGLKWSDIDTAKATIVIPATRRRTPHPDQSPSADDPQRQARPLPFARLRFPRARGGQLSSRLLDAMSRRQMGQSCSSQGFRATFSSWAHSEADFPNGLIELALAHAEGRGNAVARVTPVVRPRAIWIAVAAASLK